MSTRRTKQQNRRSKPEHEKFKEGSRFALYRSYKQLVELPSPQHALYKMTMEQFRTLKKGDFDKTTKKCDETKSQVFQLVAARPVLWQYKRSRVKLVVWEQLAYELYTRTGKRMLVEDVRHIWATGKKYLRNRLRESILKKHNPSETEEYLSTWEIYDYIRFYRDVLCQFEEELRKKVRGESFNEEVILDEGVFDDEIIFVGNFISHVNQRGAPLTNVKTEAGMEPESQDSASFQADPPSSPEPSTSAQHHLNPDYHGQETKPLNIHFTSYQSADEAPPPMLGSPGYQPAVQQAVQQQYVQHPAPSRDDIDRQIESVKYMVEKFVTDHPDKAEFFQKFMLEMCHGLSQEQFSMRSFSDFFRRKCAEAREQETENTRMEGVPDEN